MGARPILAVLRDLTAAPEAALDEALRQCGEEVEPVLRHLLAGGHITGAESEAVLRALGGPEPALRDLTAAPPDEDALHLLPPPAMRELAAVPVAIEGDGVEVAVADPTAPGLAERLAELLRPRRVSLVPAAPEQIACAIAGAEADERRARERFAEMLSDLAEGSPAGRARGAGAGPAAMASPAAEADGEGGPGAPGASAGGALRSLVRMILDQGVRRGASEIHIQPEEERVRVRYRVDGALRDAEWRIARALHAPLVARLRALAGMRAPRGREPEDGRLSLRVSGRAMDLRMAILPGVEGERVTLVVRELGGRPPSLEELGVPGGVAEALRGLIVERRAMVVCGPAGSGRSTTLAALAATFGSGADAILAVSRRAEFDLPGVTQLETDIHGPMGYAELIGAALRQRPDILVVDDASDSESWHTLVGAAAAGRRVLASLPLASPAAALAYLLESGVEPFLLTTALGGIVEQRLVRCVCGECAEVDVPPEPALARIAFPRERLRLARFRRGRGCPACAGTGYAGRTGCFGVRRVEGELRAAVLRRAGEAELAACLAGPARHGLRADALAKLARGVTTLEEVLACCPQ
jgi:type II secretory ATPase GspE/PulE/Tfp pilus assembly ATPase PilB-like protein